MPMNKTPEARLSHPIGSVLAHTPHGIFVRRPGLDDVALDDAMARVWKWADGRTVSDLAGLALLADDAFVDVECAALRAAVIRVSVPTRAAAIFAIVT